MTGPELHLKAFNIAEDIRREMPLFLYYLRTKDSKKTKISDGYYFQGNESYAFIGFVGEVDKNNRTCTIGLVCKPSLNNSDELDLYLEISYNNIDSDKHKNNEIQKQYHKLVKYLKSKGIQFSASSNPNKPYYFWLQFSSKNDASRFVKAHYESIIEKIGALERKVVITKEVFDSRMKVIKERMAFKASLQDGNKVNNTSSGLSLYSNPPLNQILYGPPGTGKTYHTIKMAIDIIEGEDSNRSYQDAQRRFSELREEGRIVFVTFHQNYSYEDFVEGLRPKTNKERTLYFEDNDGIFKRVAIEAAYSSLDNTDTKGGSHSSVSFIDLYNLYREYLEDKPDREIETRSGTNMKFVEFNNRGNLVFKHINGLGTYPASPDRLGKLYKYYKEKGIENVKNIDKEQNEVIGGANHTMFWAVINDLLTFEEQLSPEETQNRELDKADTYTAKKSIVLDAIQDKTLNTKLTKGNSNELSKPYVLIIDEINRANISRVFGELITLIEEDKRAGNKYAMTVTLPSGDPFTVPNNLYIIGTMNTADKSIALLDIALRRRFTFLPMYPEYVIDGAAIPESRFLETLNDQIANSESLGRDLQIGHSYFLDIKSQAEFYTVLKTKVVPLLLEYTMNEEKTVSDLLGRALKQGGYINDNGIIESLMPWRMPDSSLLTKQAISQVETQINEV
jgi:hypothetical protein